MNPLKKISGFIYGALAMLRSLIFGRNNSGHHYISTACFHGIHEMCRRNCKFCGAYCSCRCHQNLASEPKK